VVLPSAVSVLATLLLRDDAAGGLSQTFRAFELREKTPS
jgi:hypothetical protein